MILVGTKYDLADGLGQRKVRKEEGKKLARKLNVDAFIEYSTLSGHNNGALFDNVVEIHLAKQPKMKLSIFQR